MSTLADAVRLATATAKGKVIAIAAAIAFLVPVIDNVVALTTRTLPVTCMISGALPWCPGPTESWSDDVGGPGGATFSPITCRRNELLVGLAGKAGAPFVFSMGPICAAAEFDWRDQLRSVSQSFRDGDQVGSSRGDPFRLVCPPGTIVSGFDFDSAVVSTNFGLHEYLVTPLRLRCSSIPITTDWTAVAQASAAQSNASHKRFQCPAGSAAYAIKGRAGQFVDAVRLGCREIR